MSDSEGEIDHGLEDAEVAQTFKTIVALLQRCDKAQQDGHERLEGKGQLIKTAGMLRDQLPPEDVPASREIDPDEVFSDVR